MRAHPTDSDRVGAPAQGRSKVAVWATLRGPAIQAFETEKCFAEGAMTSDAGEFVLNA